MPNALVGTEMKLIQLTVPYETVNDDILINKVLLYNEYFNEPKNHCTEISFEVEENKIDLYNKYTFNMLLNHVDDDEAKVLALNWTTRRVISLYIQLDTISFFEDAQTPIYCFDSVWDFMREQLNRYFDGEFNCRDGNMLGVLERSPNKGWHMHILFISTIIFNKKRLDHLLKFFEHTLLQYHVIANNQEDPAMDNNDKKFKVLVNAEVCKSVGGMLNYLKKNPLRVYCDSLEVGKMFMYFKKRVCISKWFTA